MYICKYRFCVDEIPYVKIFYAIKRIYLVDIKRIVKQIINSTRYSWRIQRIDLAARSLERDRRID